MSPVSRWQRQTRSTPSRRWSERRRFTQLVVEELESRQLLAQVGLTPGWATFGQALPQGMAYDGIQLGSLPTQNDIKNRWEDGSIRFVVLTTFVPLPGNYELVAAPPFTGSANPIIPLASVRLTISGTQYTATLPINPGSFDRWLDGPYVMEGRSVVTPLRSGSQPHPFLRVYFDFRGYSDGESRLDVTVENTLDTPGATAVTYNVTITVIGLNVFQRNNVTHPYLTRWRQVIDTLLPLQSQIIPDFEPAFQAKALPYYLPIVTNGVIPPIGPTFEILGHGHLDPYMPNHAGRPELAPYPDWAARYLVHKHPTQRDYVLANGDLAGSWPIHVRETDGRFVSIDERPNYWLDPRALPGFRPAGDLGQRGPLIPDNAHQPSLAFIPYLLTGDRYYADEMALWANYVLLVTFQDDAYHARGGSMGWLHSNEVRGFGWGLRNLADAAAYLPDEYPLKSYFVEKVVNNLEWLDNYALTHQTPLGTLWERKRLEDFWPKFDDRAWIGLWEQNYLVWAADRANKHGFTGGTYHRDRVGKFHVGLFNVPYFQDGAAPYVMSIGIQDPPGSGNIIYYTELEYLYQGPVQYEGFYGPEARLMILIGLENEWEGAQEAYDYLHTLVAVNPYVLDVPDVAARAGWAVSIDGMRIQDSQEGDQEEGVADTAPETAGPALLDWLTLEELGERIPAAVEARESQLASSMGIVTELVPFSALPYLAESWEIRRSSSIARRTSDLASAVFEELFTL